MKHYAHLTIALLAPLLLAQARASTATYQDGSPTPIVGGTYSGAQDTMILYNGTTSNTGSNNFGGRTDFEVGESTPGQSFPRRDLLRFDVTLLAGQYSTINSVTLRLHLAANFSTSAGNDILQLFVEAPANAGWVEGTQTNGFEVGSSSWNHRNESGTLWAGDAGSDTAGVDYLAPVIASNGFDNTTPAGTVMDFVFNEVSFVPGWTAGSNAGLLLRIPDDLADPNLRLDFDSSESATVADHPQLIIDYAGVPEPTCLAPLAAAALILVRRREGAGNQH